jgi:hypothetical protein
MKKTSRTSTTRYNKRKNQDIGTTPYLTMVSSRRDTAKKTKPEGKPLTTKPTTTRSQFKTFHSNTAELRALVNKLKKHLTDKTQEFKGVSEETWTQWSSQSHPISEDISKRRISYANALPSILRTLAIKKKFKGAKQKGPKGTWKYTQDVHDAANAQRTSTPAGDKNKPETEKTGRESPNLLASSQESKGTPTQNLEANPFYYTEEDHMSDDDGSHSSQIPGNNKEDEDIKGPRQDKVEKNTPQPRQQVTYREISEDYDRERFSDELQANIKKGINEIEIKKKHTEANLSNQATKAHNQLILQAEKQHDSFTVMARNNMAQYTEKATTMIKAKYQELADTTITLNWTTNFETQIKKITQDKGQKFETDCLGMIKEITREHRDIYEVHLTNEEEKHKKSLKATESRMSKIQQALQNEAQNIPNKMPTDMEELKEDLEAELRAYEDGVRQDLEEAHQERHLQTMGESLIGELQTQAAAYKTDLNDLIMSQSYALTPDINNLGVRLATTEYEHNKIKKMGNPILSTPLKSTP